MTTYTVLAPPVAAGSTRPNPDRFVFVKEGFCWPAFYLTLPWLVWRRMWLTLLIYAVAAVAVVAFAGNAPLPVGWAMTVLFTFLVALEANNLRRWTLERRGYHFMGVASGDRRIDAEYRFFSGWAALENSQPAIALTKSGQGSIIETGGVVGLFPTPGARP